MLCVGLVVLVVLVWLSLASVTPTPAHAPVRLDPDGTPATCYEDLSCRSSSWRYDPDLGRWLQVGVGR